MAQKPDWVAVRIAVIYATIGSVWILSSNWVVMHITRDSAVRAQLELLKGWVYVLLTSLLLYWLIRGQLLKIRESAALLRERNEDLMRVEEELHRKMEEYRQSQGRLFEANQALNSLFEASPLAIVALDRQGRVTMWNRGAEELFGFSQAEVLGKPYPLVPGDGSADRWALFQSVLKGQAVSDIEQLRVKKSGEPLDVSISAAPLLGPQGEITGTMAMLADVTERKRIASEVKRSQAQYAALVDSIDGIVWELDIATFRFTFVSRRAETLLGYPVQEWMGSSSFWQDHIHPQDKDRTVSYCLLATAQMRDHQFEYRFLAADGRVVWLQDLVTVVIEEGRPVALRGVMLDITTRKQAEEAVAGNEELLRTVLETLPVGVWVADRQGQIIRANAAVAKIWGEADYLGRDALRMFNGCWSQTGRRIEAEESAMARALGRGESSLKEVIDIKCFDESHKTILNSVAPLHANGAIIGAVVVNQDITELKQMEQDLRAWGENYRALFAANPHPMWVFDLDTLAFLEVNDAAVRHYGWSREEFLSMTIKDIRPPEDAPAILKEITRVPSGQHLAGIWRHLKKDGSVILVDIATHALTFAGRRARMVLGNDVTERERVREEILQLNAHLEQRVRERTADLDAANKELEAFSYSVSHDLRTPLRHIDGFSQMLLEEHAGQLDADGKRYLELVRGATLRMQQLIDDMIQLAKVAQMKVERVPVDVTHAVSEILHDLKQSQPERIALFEIAPGVKATTDPRLLRIVLENLLGNAWKYTSKKERSVIRFGVIEGEERVYFIQDQGAGFDMKYADRLFTPFQRLHPSGEFEGTGIGLATVQRVIHRLNGRIWAEAVKGEGATLYFTLGESRSAHPNDMSQPKA